GRVVQPADVLTSLGVDHIPQVEFLVTTVHHVAAVRFDGSFQHRTFVRLPLGITPGHVDTAGDSLEDLELGMQPITTGSPPTFGGNPRQASDLSQDLEDA